MTDYSDEPRFHIWSLRDYADGTLLGDWIDLTPGMTEEDVLEEIFNLLRYYDEGDKVAHPDDPNFLPREEWMVGDYEGFPSRFYSESMSFGPVLQWIEDTQDMDDDRKEAYELYLDNVGSDSDLSGFEEAYQGQYDSMQDFAEQLLEDTGEIDSIPKHLQFYFDYSLYARDLELGGDYWESGGHIYRNL